MNSSILANKIKLLRKQSGYSQDMVSKALNLSRTAYANYESAARQPSLEIVVAIARFYSISLDSLLRDEYDVPLSFPLLSEEQNHT